MGGSKDGNERVKGSIAHLMHCRSVSRRRYSFPFSAALNEAALKSKEASNSRSNLWGNKEMLNIIFQSMHHKCERDSEFYPPPVSAVAERASRTFLAKPNSLCIITAEKQSSNGASSVRPSAPTRKGARALFTTLTSISEGRTDGGGGRLFGDPPSLPLDEIKPPKS